MDVVKLNPGKIEVLLAGDIVGQRERMQSILKVGLHPIRPGLQL